MGAERRTVSCALFPNGLIRVVCICPVRKRVVGYRRILFVGFSAWETRSAGCVSAHARSNQATERRSRFTARLVSQFMTAPRPRVCLAPANAITPRHRGPRHTQGLRSRPPAPERPRAA